MKSFAKIICTLLASLMLFSPLLANAQATDTSGGAAVTANGAAAANGNGNAAANAANAAQNQVQQNGKLTSCAFYSITCWLQTGVQWVAALFVSIAVWIMIFNGWLFDLAISETVLGFNGWVQGDVLTAITTGWTFFRDIANIVIIGLFVFIAICIILGVKSYGQRSLIARVLIVAVLLNFSFLFTRIVINFSNALATQFAKVQPLNASAANIGTKPADISGKFTDLMGVKSITETKDTLALISQNSNSTWLMLLHALFFIFLSLGVAIVLLYGTILLIIRAIIFIFLLVTSSLAFSTYLLPSLASSDFGWKAWWTALFRNALLAPILMLFLAIALQVSTGLKVALIGGQNGGATGGSLGALAAHPNDPQNMSAFMIYIIILGLLYGTIRISNRFAGAAGQMAWAGTLPFANATVAWPSRSLGFLGRNTIGREAEKFGKNMQDKAKANFNAGRTNWGYVQDKFALAAKAVAKRDFNAGNYSNIKSAKTNLGGFTGQEQRRQKEIQERAKRNAYSDAELKTSKAALDKARNETSEDGKTKRGDAYDANQKALEAAKKMSEAASQEAEAAKKNRDAMQKEVDQLQKTLTSTPQNQRQEVENKLKEKENEMMRETDKIVEKRNLAQRESQNAANLDSEGKKLREMLNKRAEIYMSGSEKFIPAAHDLFGPNKRTKSDRAADIAVEDAYQRFSNVLNRAAGQTIESDKWAQNMRGKTKESIHHDDTSKSVEKLAKQIEKLSAHTEHAADQAHEDHDKETDILKSIKNNTNHH